MLALKIIAVLILMVYQHLAVPVLQDHRLIVPEAAGKIKRPALKIKVARDGSISHGDKKITVKKLTSLCAAHKKKHPNGALNIQAHKQTSIKHVRVVLNAASEADLTLVVVDGE